MFVCMLYSLYNTSIWRNALPQIGMVSLCLNVLCMVNASTVGNARIRPMNSYKQNLWPFYMYIYIYICCSWIIVSCRRVGFNPSVRCTCAYFVYIYVVSLCAIPVCSETRNVTSIAATAFCSRAAMTKLIRSRSERIYLARTYRYDRTLFSFMRLFLYYNSFAIKSSLYNYIDTFACNTNSEKNQICHFWQNSKCVSHMNVNQIRD